MQISKPISSRPSPSRHWRVFTLAFGIVLPVICLLIERVDHTWARMMFDPVPTALHQAAILFVVATNLVLLVAAEQLGGAAARLVASAAAGGAIGVSFVYLCAFLPCFPIACLGVLAGGLGLLPMTPVLCFAATVLAVRRLTRQMLTRFELVALSLSVSACVFLLVADDVRRYGVARELARAEGGDEAQSAAAVRWLRRHTSHEDLLAATRGRTRGTGLLDIYLGSRPRLGRETYYRITGRSLDRDRARSGGGGGGRRGPLGSPPPPDSEGVRVVESRFDGSIDLVGATAYLQWTLVVENPLWNQAAGWLTLRLPPGGVVSRATLWVRGRPQEAAWAAHEKAERAYQEIAVVQRRDPLLVEHRGPDRVRLRFSPVPPRGGHMRFLIGMSVPLELRGLDRARLVLPVVQEGDTQLDSGLKHALWIESGLPFSLVGEDIVSSPRERDVHAIETVLADEDHPGLGHVVLDLPRPAIRRCYAGDPRSAHRVVVQSLEPAPDRAPSRVIVVVDASGPMRRALRAVADALDSPAADAVVGVVIGADPPLLVADRRDAARELRRLEPLGGHDGALALEDGFRAARAARASTVVWVHGEQPVLLSDGLALEQHVERGGGAVSVIDVAVSGRRNVVSARLARLGVSRAAPAGPDLAGSLHDVLEQCAGRRPIWRAERRFLDAEDRDPDLPAAAKDVTRLRVAADIARRAVDDPAGAIDAGRRYRLVTAVTSAVCLETAEQNERFGLKPVDRSTVPDIELPTVPEPGTWMLIVAATAIGLVFAWRARAAA